MRLGTRGQSVLLILIEQLKERIRDLEEKVRQLEQQNPGLAAALAKAQQQSGSGGARSGTPPSSGSNSARGGGGYPAFDPAAQQQGWNNPYLGNTEQQQRLPHSDLRSTAQDPYGAGFPAGGGGGGGASGQVIPGMNQFMLSAAQQHAQNLRAMDPSMFAVAPDTSNDPLPSELDPNELCVFPPPLLTIECILSICGRSSTDL